MTLKYLSNLSACYLSTCDEYTHKHIYIHTKQFNLITCNTLNILCLFRHIDDTIWLMISYDHMILTDVISLLVIFFFMAIKILYIFFISFPLLYVNFVSQRIQNSNYFQHVDGIVPLFSYTQATKFNANLILGR